MNVLDWLLVALVVAYALSGYWQGFVVGASATLGLLVGGLVGVWVAPMLLGDASPGLLVSLGALFVVLLSASLGQALFQQVGARVRSQIRWQPVRAVDAVGGAVLSAAAALLVAWVLGVAVSGAQIPALAQQVRSSAVLGEVDALMPRSADEALDAFNDVVSASVFPRYLEPFADEQIVEVAPAPKRVVRDPDIRDAQASVVKVRGDNDCGQGIEGTGFWYSKERVMTNAHVVAGVSEPSVLVGDREVPATVVYYDPDVDVAVLSVDLRRPFLSFDRSGRRGQPAAVAGYPNDGPYTVEPARIRNEQRLRSPDIYGEGAVIREVYSVRGEVRPGNSGGPLLSRAGRVLGVVFAASVSDGDTGYVLTADQVAAAAARGISSTTPVGTGDCA